MYILINNKTNKVEHFSNKTIIGYSNNLILAEVESLPEKYDYLTAENIREITDKWTEKKIIEEYDENGELVTNEIEVEKSRTYTTCDLKACFKEVKEPTLEQTEIINRKLYEQLVEKLIARRYSASNELALIRQQNEKAEEYQEYYAYCEECKRQAKIEIYGE